VNWGPEDIENIRHELAIKQTPAELDTLIENTVTTRIAEEAEQQDGRSGKCGL
jgi:hypothetical protein